MIIGPLTMFDLFFSHVINIFAEGDSEGCYGGTRNCNEEQIRNEEQDVFNAAQYPTIAALKIIVNPGCSSSRVVVHKE